MSRFFKMYLIVVGLSAMALSLMYWNAERSLKRAGEDSRSRPLTERQPHRHTPQDISLLDSPDITLKDLGKIFDGLDGDSQLMFEARIIALRQILLVLGSSTHSASAIHDVFTLYRDDLSPQQREVVDWFEAGGRSLERKWELAPGVFSLSDMQRVLSYDE